MQWGGTSEWHSCGGQGDPVKARTALDEKLEYRTIPLAFAVYLASNIRSCHIGTNSSLGGADRGQGNLSISHPSCLQCRAAGFRSRKKFFPGEPASKAPKGKMLKRFFGDKKTPGLWADPLSYFHWKCYFVSHAGPVELLCWKLAISLSHFSL